ncbi:long-chain fatty acid transport protein 6 isoform X1 [Pelodiscus sinensis]|uniref:long-chain fatty acid transport protein 6 isoform X1 n=1 Tax=Pelodiscus sinensis TaxID=13735 RepID=UPI0003C48573|nr:long-chain fatty acid transport protein 6 isoform X1 [Pelodiscus sinensis]|eukprot:XP_006131931.1 long-chain fatty acid transport protein 6 isoform X1 [Pelodiscus sinensis]
MLSSWVTGAAAGIVFLHLVQKFLFPYFWLDLNYLLKVVIHGLTLESYRLRGKIFTVLDRFVKEAERQPRKPFILYEGNVHTYQDVDRRSNRVAHVLLQEGALKKGDTVALLMSNEPDFIHVWFGAVKLGCVVAFLNINIHAKSLLHCISSCEPKMLVVGADMVGTLKEILPSLQKDIDVWVMTKDCTLPNVKTLLDKLEAASEDGVPVNLRSVNNLKSSVLYIFTSGTTGLPKAAVITHLQVLKGAAGLWAFGATANDIIYITLPLYHSSASLLGIGGCIVLGATIVLRKKFSASQFWSDCKKYNVTVIQHIGEICRYLCNQPVKEGEKDHKVRMAIGNGLRSDVWQEFLVRFGDLKMCEFYAATEGNICFMNHCGKIGSVGRTNFFYELFFPFDLIKYDIQKDELIRNKHGWCEKVKKGEAGLLISKVNVKNPFFGYTGSKIHTEKKLLHEVFKKGDLYFNTGDLMVQDKENFLYFWDRIGDTYRWKGENVSTTEVSDVIGMLDFIQDANVYGVPVPGHEGNVGMVSVVLKPNRSLDLKQMYEQVVMYLPGYACPIFLRLQEIMEVTGTFKQQKFKLVSEGFNPSSITDQLYFLDRSKKSYVPLTKELYEKIFSGQLKL